MYQYIFVRGRGKASFVLFLYLETFSRGGEKMKKNILLITVLLLTFAFISIPVMAKPATKIEGVTVTAVVTQTPNPGFPRLVSHDAIGHTKGTSTGTVAITIPTEDPLNPIVLNGDWKGEFVTRGKFTLDPAEVLIRGKLVWTFTGGTFEGVIQRTIIGYPPGPSSIFIDHAVLHGTGDFRGQTLKISFEGTPPIIQEGYLINPK
jgi:hypothetical protein